MTMRVHINIVAPVDADDEDEEDRNMPASLVNIPGPQ
jgi:hypothetical protein